MTVKVLGLTLYGTNAASTRHRLTQYIPGLSALGIEMDVHGLLGNEYIQRSYAGMKYPLRNYVKDYISRLALLLRQRKYDVALINAELFPLLPGWIETKLIRIPFIYDFDDAFFLKYQLERFKLVSFLLRNKFSPVLCRAKAVLAGNAYLADYAVKHNSATQIFPTVVDTERYRPEIDVANNSKDDVFSIGWIGTPSTSVYLNELRAPLTRLSREIQIRFVVVGGTCAPIPGVEVICRPWTEMAEVSEINRFDVGVMPLFDDAWARGKCAFKLIQYMACGVPVVASRVGTNVEVVTSECGILATTCDEWLQSLKLLGNDRHLRCRMGEAGRQRVVDRYSLHTTLPKLADLIQYVAT